MTSTSSPYFSKGNSKRLHSSGSSDSETPKKRLGKTTPPSRKSNTAVTEEEKTDTTMSIQETLTMLGQRMDAIVRQLDILATKDDVSTIKEEVKTLTQTFTEQIQKVEGRLFDIEAKTDLLTKEVQSLKREKETLQDVVKQQERQIQQIQKDQNSLQQYSRRWNLRVFRVPEKEGETGAECAKKCCDIFSQQVMVPTDVSDVEVAHRTGQPGGSKPRPIIIRFFDRKKRDAVLANRRNLKGKGIVVGEDLTHASYKVFRDAKQHSACLSVWSSNGNVIVKLKNGKIMRLDIHTNVLQAFRRAMAGQDQMEEN